GVRATGRMGLAAAAGVPAVMTAVLARSLRRGARVRCRCFGAGAADVTGGHLVRNGIVIAVALLGLVGATIGGRSSAGGVAVAVVAGVIGGVLLVRWDDLALLVGGAPLR